MNAQSSLRRSMFQAITTSLRATATVAMFAPRLAATR